MHRAAVPFREQPVVILPLVTKISLVAVLVFLVSFQQFNDRRSQINYTSGFFSLCRIGVDALLCGVKNLFTFNNAVLDLKGYAGEGDFVETYLFSFFEKRFSYYHYSISVADRQ